MKKTTYFFATMLIFLSSCAVYYPQPVDIPLISEKGDLRIDAGGLLVSGVLVGGHSTVSYGITNVLAAQVYASLDLVGRSYIQFAPGLFNSFENDRVIEFYGGYGFGADSWGGSYQLAFSQFNIGKVGTRFEHGFGLKGGYIFAQNELYIHRNSPQENGWLIEPSVMLRYGNERVKFSTRINFLWTESIPRENYMPLTMSVGVNINLNTRTSKTPRIINFE